MDGRTWMRMPDPIHCYFTNLPFTPPLINAQFIKSINRAVVGAFDVPQTDSHTHKHGGQSNKRTSPIRFAATQRTEQDNKYHVFEQNYLRTSETEPARAQETRRITSRKPRTTLWTGLDCAQMEVGRG